VDLPEVLTFPEGLAYDAARNVIYVGSAINGALVRVDLKTGASTTLLPPGTLAADTGAFPRLNGMKVDAQNRLWIAAGAQGRMFVLDAASGKMLKQLEVPNPAGSLINDVALAGGAAYFTDTRFGTMWRVQTKGNDIGELEPWLTFEGTALQYAQGANLNGIAATADGRFVIAGHMSRGQLFRIDTSTKAVSQIDTGGADLTSADGLVLDGTTLYVVRQAPGEIATVRLNPEFSKGTVVSRFAHPMLVFPATAAKVGNELFVVNSQFNRRNNKTQVLPFNLVKIPTSALTSSN
jgi:Cu-Zn family superoxide dismutase